MNYFEKDHDYLPNPFEKNRDSASMMQGKRGAIAWMVVVGIATAPFLDRSCPVRRAKPKERVQAIEKVRSQSWRGVPYK